MRYSGDWIGRGEVDLQVIGEVKQNRGDALLIQKLPSMQWLKIIRWSLAISNAANCLT